MYRKFCLKIFVLIILLYSIGYSQRIAISDLPYFYGCYSTTTNINGQLVYSPGFYSWRLVRADTNGRIDESFINHKDCRNWYYSWDAEINPPVILENYNINLKNSDLVFLILMEYGGWERQQNLLTVWKRFNNDSLSFVCAQAGPFDTGLGGAHVQYVGYFPDNSVLLVVFKSGEGYGEYAFYRGNSPCDFSQYHSAHWSNGGDDAYIPHWEYSYDFERTNDYYGSKNVELAKFYNADSMGVLTMDSSKCQIVDFWQLAKDYYKIEDVK